MSREKKLNDSLKPILRNRKSTHKNLEVILEQCEQAIISSVFEKRHGERLLLDNVINHLKDLNNEKNLNDNNDIQNMINNLYAFKNFIIDIKKGNKGERFVKKALDKITIPSHIIENVQLSYNGITTEDDFIVINQNGLFIIEVKYSSNDMCITEDGFYVPANNPYVSLGSRNVLEQTSNEHHVVLNVLSDKLEIPNKQELSTKIHSLILFANRNQRLFDQSKSEKVVFCHNVSSYISTFDKGTKLTNEEIEKFVEILQKNEDNTEYNINFDLDGLRDSFVKGLCLLENGKIEEAEEIHDELAPSSKLTNKPNWYFDWISAGIGSIATGIGLAYYKYYTNQKAI